MDGRNNVNSGRGMHYSPLNSDSDSKASPEAPGSDRTTRQTSTGERHAGRSLTERRASNTSVNWNASINNGSEPKFEDMFNRIHRAYQKSRDAGAAQLTQCFKIMNDGDETPQKAKLFRFVGDLGKRSSHPVLIADLCKCVDGEKNSGLSDKHKETLQSGLKKGFALSVSGMVENIRAQLDEGLSLPPGQLEVIKATTEQCGFMAPGLLRKFLDRQGGLTLGTWLRRGAEECYQNRLKEIGDDAWRWHNPGNSSARETDQYVQQQTEKAAAAMATIISHCSKQTNQERRIAHCDQQSKSCISRLQPLINERRKAEFLQRPGMRPEEIPLMDALALEAAKHSTGTSIGLKVIQGICHSYPEDVVKRLSDRLNAIQCHGEAWEDLPADFKGYFPHIVANLETVVKAQRPATDDGEHKGKALMDKALQLAKKAQAGADFSQSDMALVKDIIKDGSTSLINKRVGMLRLGTLLRRQVERHTQLQLTELRAGIGQYCTPWNSTADSMVQRYEEKRREIEAFASNAIDVLSKKKKLRKSELQESMEKSDRQLRPVIDQRKWTEAANYYAMSPDAMKLFNQLMSMGKNAGESQKKAIYHDFCANWPEASQALLSALNKVDWQKLPSEFALFNGSMKTLYDVLKGLYNTGAAPVMARPAASEQIPAAVFDDPEPLYENVSSTGNPLIAAPVLTQAQDDQALRDNGAEEMTRDLTAFSTPGGWSVPPQVMEQELAQEGAQGTKEMGLSEQARPLEALDPPPPPPPPAPSPKAPPPPPAPAPPPPPPLSPLPKAAADTNTRSALLQQIRSAAGQVPKKSSGSTGFVTNRESKPLDNSESGDGLVNSLSGKIPVMGKTPQDGSENMTDSVEWDD